MSRKLNLLSAVAVTALTTFNAQAGVIGIGITGVMDGPLFGGVPKIVELYAYEDIADLSEYSLSTFSNDGLTPSGSVTFSGSVSAGDFFYAASSTTSDGELTSFFGSLPSSVFREFGSSANVNGDDPLQLMKGVSVVDSFGVVGTDGTGEPWEYRDGWAYRKDATGPDGSTFDLANWSFSGLDALDGFADNAAAGSAAFPIGTFQSSVNVVPLPAGGLLLGTGLVALGFARRRKAA